MPAYLTANGDSERNDSRSTSPNSYPGSRYVSQYSVGWIHVETSKLIESRPRSVRGRKEMGVIGQASWISSVINLLNTSM